jgi:hypothetical protein
MGRTGAGRSPVPGASLVARMDQSNATRSGPTFRMNRFDRSHTATSLRPGSFMGTTFGFFGMFDTVGRCSQEKSSQRAVACRLRRRQTISDSLWHAKEGVENISGAEARPTDVRSRLCGGVQESDGAAGRATGDTAAGPTAAANVQNEVASDHKNEDRVMIPLGSRRGSREPWFESMTDTKPTVLSDLG